jgi:hypothetical protein
MKRLRVLIACEYSGTVRAAFTAAGHDAMSCDLLPSETPGEHYQGDVFDVLDHGFDLLIAHPPCTYLCNSGVRWLHERPERWAELDNAAKFFWSLLHADIPRIAIENPIPHKYAVERIGRTYDQILQPYEFGHGETKATCLWLRNLPPLEPTDVVDGRTARVHRMPPGEDRSKERSRFYTGIAEAMATQWSALEQMRLAV